MKKIRSRSRGFSLVEVALALGIAAFCLVALFGLLPVGVSSNQMSIQQTAAANLAAAVLADLKAIPKGSLTTLSSPRYQIPEPPASGAKMHSLFLHDDGSLAGTLDANASATTNPRYRVTITYAVPTTPGYFAVPTDVLVTWPALADATVSAAPVNFAGAFEINSALDRN